MTNETTPGFLVAWDSCWQRAASEVPDSVMEQVRRNWYDTLAATAGGVSANCTQAALVLGTASHALDYDDVCMLATCHPSVRIDIEVPKNGLSALKHPQPATGLQAKFSGHYCAAVAWIDGRVELASFDDAAIARADVQALMQRTTLTGRTSGGESLDTAPVHVTVRAGGWSDTITVDWAPGSPADPMTRGQLRRKWADCARQGGMAADDAQSARFTVSANASRSAAVCASNTRLD